MTNDKKQTAVEWLVKIYLQTGKIDSFDIDQAKAMEEEQKKDAFLESRLTHPILGFKHESFEQYYNETYKQQ
jgi:hypothetical protein